MSMLFGSDSLLWDDADEENDPDFDPAAAEEEEHSQRRDSSSSGDEEEDDDGDGDGDGDGTSVNAQSSVAASRTEAAPASASAPAPAPVQRMTRARNPLHNVAIEELEAHLPPVDWEEREAEAARRHRGRSGTSSATAESSHLLAPPISPPLAPPPPIDNPDYRHFLQTLNSSHAEAADDDDEEFRLPEEEESEEDEEEFRNDKTASISRKEVRALRRETREFTAEPSHSPTKRSSATSTRRKDDSAHAHGLAQVKDQPPSRELMQLLQTPDLPAAALPPTPGKATRSKPAARSQPSFFASAHSLPSSSLQHQRRQRPPAAAAATAAASSSFNASPAAAFPEVSPPAGLGVGSLPPLPTIDGLSSFLSPPPLFSPPPSGPAAAVANANPAAAPSSSAQVLAAAAASTAAAVAGSSAPSAPAPSFSLLPSTNAAGAAPTSALPNLPLQLQLLTPYMLGLMSGGLPQPVVATAKVVRQKKPAPAAAPSSVEAPAAVPVLAPAPVAPSKPVAAPAVPRSEWTEVQRHQLIEQLDQHVQLLVQLRYLSLNSVLTPQHPPNAAMVEEKLLTASTAQEHSEAEGEVEERKESESGSNRKPVLSHRQLQQQRAPLLPLKALWDGTKEMLDELVTKRDVAVRRWKDARAEQEQHTLANPFADEESGAAAAASLWARPVLSFAALLDTWQEVETDHNVLSRTHAALTREQDQRVPITIWKQATVFLKGLQIPSQEAGSEAGGNGGASAAGSSSSAVRSGKKAPTMLQGRWCHSALLTAFIAADAQSRLQAHLLPAIPRLTVKHLWTPAEDALLATAYASFGRDEATEAGSRLAVQGWARMKNRYLPARAIYEIRRRHHNIGTLARKELREEAMQDDDAADEQQQQEEEERPLSPVAEPASAATPPADMLDEERKEEAPAPALVARAVKVQAVPAVANVIFSREASCAGAVLVPAASLPTASSSSAAPAASSSSADAAGAAAAAAGASAPAAAAAAAAVPVPSTFRPTSTHARELSVEEMSVLEAGLKYFPATTSKRWQKICDNFLPEWDRKTLRRAWMRIEKRNELLARGGKRRKQPPKPNAEINALLEQARATARIRQEAAAAAAASAGAAARVAAFLPAGNAMAGADMRRAENDGNEASFDLTRPLAAPSLVLSLPHSPHMAVPVPPSLVAAAAAQAQTQAQPMAAPVRSSSSALPASTFVLNAPSASPAAPPAAAEAQFEEMDVAEEEEQVEEEAAVEPSSAAVPPSAFVTPAASAPRGRTRASAAAAAGGVTLTPAKRKAPSASSAASPSARSQSHETASHADSAGEAPDAAASMLALPSSRQLFRNRTPKKDAQLQSALISLAHSSELVETVPAPLRAPLHEQLAYSADALAYASSNSGMEVNGASPSKRARRSKHATTPMRSNGAASAAGALTPALASSTTPVPAAAGSSVFATSPAATPIAQSPVAAAAAAAVAEATRRASRPPPRSSRNLAVDKMQKSALGGAAASGAKFDTWSQMQQMLRSNATTAASATAPLPALPTVADINWAATAATTAAAGASNSAR